MTKEEASKYVESFKTDKGGFTRDSLAKLGVSWPPKSGWRKDLIVKLSNWEKQSAPLTSMEVVWKRIESLETQVDILNEYIQKHIRTQL